jgi:hypothetical protein
MIVPARECHVCQMLVRGIRQEDVNEMKAASGHAPEYALMRSLRASTKAWACVNDSGIACAIWGVAPWPMTPKIGSPWLIATDDFIKHRVDIVRHTRRCVQEMGEGFDFLCNYVDIRLISRLPWMEWAGFKYDRYIPELGLEGRPFLRFSKAT